ncbi:MAG: DUF2238 domain-containing protein [Pseudomonadota bacterium]|nr:DUF2238 domain-containing protein [Pseudomonadota bacterium]
MTPLWLTIYGAVLLWSAIDPKDYLTWWLEVTPALVALVLLFATRKRFQFTPLVYWLVLAHSIILMVGAHYTYAEVPLFDWIKALLHSDRNNFDKLGHFAQGFVPALVAREIVIRHNAINGHYWTSFFVVCFSLAVSAFYELIEWWVAVASGDSAEAFLGTQGYVWDTQSDMGMALLGAIVAVVVMRRVHGRQMARM